MPTTDPSTSRVRSILESFGFIITVLIMGVTLSAVGAYSIALSLNQDRTSQCRSKANTMFDNAFSELLIDLSEQRPDDLPSDIYNLRLAQAARTEALQHC